MRPFLLGSWLCGRYTYQAVVVSFGGGHCLFFVVSHTEMVVDDVFAVFDIVRSLHIDAELGEVGAQFAKLERRTFAEFLVKTNSETERARFVEDVVRTFAETDKQFIQLFCGTPIRLFFYCPNSWE